MTNKSILQTSFYARICGIGNNAPVFSHISERNNDYSDKLDFKKGRAGEVGLVRVHPWMNPIVFGNNRPNRTTDMGENVPPKLVFRVKVRRYRFFWGEKT